MGSLSTPLLLNRTMYVIGFIVTAQLIVLDFVLTFAIDEGIGMLSFIVFVDAFMLAFAIDMIRGNPFSHEFYRTWFACCLVEFKFDNILFLICLIRWIYIRSYGLLSLAVCRFEKQKKNDNEYSPWTVFYRRCY